MVDDFLLYLVTKSEVCVGSLPLELMDNFMGMYTWVSGEGELHRELGNLTSELFAGRRLLSDLYKSILSQSKWNFNVINNYSRKVK